jgi:hypothetical protein
MENLHQRPLAKDRTAIAAPADQIVAKPFMPRLKSRFILAYRAFACQLAITGALFLTSLRLAAPSRRRKSLASLMAITPSEFECAGFNIASLYRAIKICTLRPLRASNPIKSDFPTADLSGNLTANRPGKSDAWQGCHWFSWIGVAFHDRILAELADFCALIDRTNLGGRLRCLVEISPLILRVLPTSVRQ